MSLLSDFHNVHNLHKTAQWFKLVILYSRCSSGSDLGWDPGSPSELDCRLSRWSLNLQLIIETCRAQSEVSIIHWSPTVLWTMFFFMSLSFFLLTLFSNLWIAPGHKSMWIRHLAYFKILATYTTIERPTHRIFPLDCQSHRFIHTATAWWQTLALSPG